MPGKEEAMPSKPKHPCASPGCPNLVEYGKRFCKEHEKAESRRYEKYDRNKAAVRRRYGPAWRRIRARYVKSHPYCELCFREGRMVPVEEVHHIKPLSEGGSNDPSNLMSLCKACHSSLHARRGDRWNMNKEYK